VRQLVELHGGTVSVASGGEGRGTTFTVNLPVLPIQKENGNGAPALPQKTRTAPASDCPPQLSGLRVLIVDDEPDSLDLINLVLASCGAETTAVSSAAEAFEALRRASFDAFVSDIGMPEEDGLSLIGRIRELPAGQGGRIPALALTAYAREEDRAQALEAGFQMHLSKPFEHSELIKTVSRLAEQTKSPEPK
jgi:CheY-like chemotaxis protein